jgi:hypothetical protein
MARDDVPFSRAVLSHPPLMQSTGPRPTRSLLNAIISQPPDAAVASATTVDGQLSSGRHKTLLADRAGLKT